MQLTLLGLNHKSAPVELREKFALNPERMSGIYKQLLKCCPLFGCIREAFILSTCNRVEYYIFTDTPSQIYNLVAGLNNINTALLKKHSYMKSGTEAIEHIMLVTAGVDSLVLGEPQIAGQVKQSFKTAEEHGAVKNYLSRLQQSLFSTSKKIRTQTAISENPVSVSYAAVALAKKIFGSFEGRGALVVGAGQMCELAAEHLSGGGISRMYITNRTHSAALELASKFNAETVEFSNFPQILGKVDIIVTSTGAPTFIIDRSMVEPAMKKRRNAPVFFIDIAVPRDVAPDVCGLDNVYVYDMDDLEHVVEHNSALRKEEAAKAREIAKEAAVAFERSLISLKAAPAIVKVRKLAGTINEHELEKYCAKYKITDEKQIDGLRYMLYAASNKLLHTPSVNIKRMAQDDKTDVVSTFEKIFGVNNNINKKK